MSSLNGIKVVEIEGLGPAPVAGMMLADMGAEVILIQRKTTNPNAAQVSDGKEHNFFHRGKKAIALDLKQPEAVEVVLSIVKTADVFIEAFRPGVIERLGLGPDVCMEVNPGLVYGRMTGWGQTGPLSHASGHDLNYIAISGALHYSGLAGDIPFTPATVVGDIAGGTLHLIIGILAALSHVHQSGEGQVIDAAICDGSAQMMTLLASLHASGIVGTKRGGDIFTGASHWAMTYECSDGKYITVESLEPNFYREFVSKLGLDDDPDFSNQLDSKTWPAAMEKLKKLFKNQPQAYWNEILEGSDACYAPVLNLEEAANHPHNRARNNFIINNGIIEPAPAPKFDKTPSQPGKIPTFGQHTKEVIQSLDLPAELLEKLDY